MRANETYLEAKRQFSVRNSDVPINVLSPHKSAVVGMRSSLPPLVVVVVAVP